jgi:hypothetical protein
MKWVFWVLFILLFGLLLYLVYNFAALRRGQVNVADAAFSSDSVVAYEERAVELRLRADSLRQRLDELNLLKRLQVSFRAQQLDREVAALEQAIAEWKGSAARRGKTDLYNRCVILYGRASGVCDALASDTLGPVEGD